jgi:PAS domain S-box-containing protein
MLQDAAHSADANRPPDAVEFKSGLRALRVFSSLRSRHILMAVLSVLMLTALGYLALLQSRSTDMVRSTALREAQTLLAGMTAAGSGMEGAHSFQNAEVLFLPDSAAANASLFGPEDRDALRRLPVTPGSSSIHFYPALKPTHLHYFGRLSDGRVAMISQSLSGIEQPINRHLARSFLATGILALLFIGGLVWTFRAARRDLALLQDADSATRAAVLDSVVADSPSSRTRRNRLPWILASTFVVFLIDCWLNMMPVSGALYVLAVILSLSSTRTWHIVVTAVWVLLLSFLPLIIWPPTAPLWLSLSGHALVAYFIVGAAAFGSSLLRRVRGESVAIARASQAREESDRLRTALTRAAAAESRMTTVLERLTLATRYAGVSIWEWDLVADMLYPTEGSDFRARLGSSTHVRGGEFIRTFVHPDDRDAFAEAFRSAIANEHGDAPIVHRYRALTADGSVQHIQLHARVHRDAAGHPKRVVGVDWNITREVDAALELQHQTEQLRDAERRLERASLSSLEGHWETDLLSGHSWISSSFRELMGFKPGEFEAMQISAAELAHPDDVARAEAAYLGHLQQGSPYDLRLRLRNARSEYQWFRIHGAAERDNEGRPVRMSGSIQNIQQQHAAEEALKAVQARFERAIHGTQDGLFDLDLTTDSAWFSPRYRDMLGYGADEFHVGVRELQEHVHPDDRSRISAAFLELVRHNVNYDVEYRLRRKSGAYLWVHSRAIVEFGRDGRATRLSGSIQDITEARAAREQLLTATASAKSANEAKSAFLATMSHEIRTPMNGVIGMTGLLLDTPLDRIQREYANTIRSSADSLLHVINDILDFSKIEAGRLDIDVTDMDLRANIDEVCGMMALQAASKRVELIVDMRAEVPELVRGDAQRIRQCLLNLLSNAVKFTPSGEVIVEVCVLAQQPNRTLVQFSVRDTGIGLTEEQMQSLFNPFVQADSSTTRQYGGTGLGLSIVKQLAELMGGHVGVESELGRGTTFWFTLPLEPLDPAGRFARTSAALVGRRVLVVDDNDANRKVLCGQLEREGCEVTTAVDATDALRLMQEARQRQRTFDVALLDFQMPGMDGASLGESINADAQLSGTRLVLLTSMDRSGDHQRFASIGFAAYLTKPVRAMELKQCLERIVGAEAKEWHMRTQPMVTRNVLSESLGEPRYMGSVLLVEDNLVNRQVAQKFLERLGCQVRTAPDGLAAVAAFKTERFNLILMDMQMPHMDGITATREIRALERGGQHTPIVALTANVLAGQLERCLEAGMDDFLAKPLDVTRLRDVLDRFGLAMPGDVLHSHGGPKQEEFIEIDSPSVSLDAQRLESIAGTDHAFARELLQTYLDSMTQLVAETRAAIEDDREGLGRAAHKMKGASANVGAERARRLSAQMEEIAVPGSARELRALIESVASELGEIQRHANQLYPP